MTAPFYADPLVTLHLGDCLDVMRELPDASVDAVVTDPPYGLEFMGKEWDKLQNRRDNQSELHNQTPDSTGRGSWAFGGTPSSERRVVYRAGKIAQDWHEAWATEAFRVAKPGAYLLAFGGTRTVHRLAAAIEDAGWEIRDMLMWVYASGFPKSLDVGKALDKAAGAERPVIRERNWHDPMDTPFRKHYGGDGPEGQPTVNVTGPATDLARQWDGWGTALKPAHEPIVMARKPLVGTVAANVTRFGTGAINIGATRIGYAGSSDHDATAAKANKSPETKAVKNGTSFQGTGEFMDSAGRWPSNVLLSSPELFDQANPYVVGSGATATSGSRTGEYDGSGAWSGPYGPVGRDLEGDSGGYSRFFIIPKADRAERERGLAGAPKEVVNITEGHGMGPVNTSKKSDGGIRVNNPRANVHPTVKPIDLMRHLVRLVTPPGGVCLDPFLGSGTTALAASEEGMRCIGIEREAEYLEIAKGRLMATDIGLGLDVPAPVAKRSRSRGHWPKDRPAGRDGWGFSGQGGLLERFDDEVTP